MVFRCAPNHPQLRALRVSRVGHYILSKDVDHLEYEDYKLRAQAYKDYLSSIREKLDLDPPDFIYEDWYRSSKSHKCSHDASLDRLQIMEDDKNEVQIQLRLLGAFHDGFMTYTYRDVQYYKLNRHESSFVKSSHGDLRYEEFRLDENEYIVHEFDWYSLDENAVFLIACKRIEYVWEQLSDGEKPSREARWRA